MPRPANESALVPVEFKKALRYQSSYFKSRMRPNFCRKAIIKLKESGNKHYTDIEVSEEVTETIEDETQKEISFVVPKNNLASNSFGSF